MHTKRQPVAILERWLQLRVIKHDRQLVEAGNLWDPVLDGVIHGGDSASFLGEEFFSKHSIVDSR